MGQYIGWTWQPLGTRRRSRIGSVLEIRNQQLGCGCERTDFLGWNHDNYAGLSVVINREKSVISSVTCSNMPVYSKK